MTEPHDAHVLQARQLFRASGFDLAALQYPRSVGALIALKRFNGMTDDAKVPVPWLYHPNEWCYRRWRETGRLV